MTEFVMRDLEDYLYLKDLVNDFGGEKDFRIFVPMEIKQPTLIPGIYMTSGRDRIMIECKLDTTEESLYRLDEGYKVRLIPADDNLRPFIASWLVYQSDLLHMIKCDDWAFVKLPGEKVKFIEWNEYITPLAYIHHEGQIIVKEDN